MQSIPILTYHEISWEHHPLYQRFTVTPEMFDRQMSWLVRRGYQSVTLDQVHSARHGGQGLPQRPIVITFDDGCRSCVEVAAATLVKYRLTGTFFLVTGYMGARTTWMTARRQVALPVIDWRTARDLATSGLVCGSHTVTHRRLAELSASECRVELLQSREVLEDQLGYSVVHLSYPYGSFNEQVRDMACEAGYHTACSIQSGLSGPSDDLLALHRVTVSGQETFTDFTFRVRTAKRASEVLPRPIYSVATKAKRLVNAFSAHIRG